MLEHALKCNISCTWVEKFAAATAVYLAPSQKTHQPGSRHASTCLVTFDSSGQVEIVLAAGAGATGATAGSSFRLERGAQQLRCMRRHWRVVLACLRSAPRKSKSVGLVSSVLHVPAFRIRECGAQKKWAPVRCGGRPISAQGCVGYARADWRYNGGGALLFPTRSGQDASSRSLGTRGAVRRGSPHRSPV